MSPRISGPPTHAPFHHGIREGPATTSSEPVYSRSDSGALGRSLIDRAEPAPPAVSAGAPVVIMPNDDGGIDLFAEDRTYTLARRELQALLFLRIRVDLNEDGSDRATVDPWPGRRWVWFYPGGRPYLVAGDRVIAVLRGDVPAAELVRVGVP